MWSFGATSDWSVRSTPKNTDFFIDAESSAAEDLVREVTQNSLDAVRNGAKTVTVRFRFGTMDRDEFHSRYMEGLSEHLAACDPSAAGIIGGAGCVSFLAVEDFGTRGLDGPADRVSDKSNYNRFWWSYGDSVKEGGDGGRHGVGKSTIAECSRLKFFFGLTVRADDKKTILTGQTVLRPHHLPGDGGKWFEPYGFFGQTKPPSEPQPFSAPCQTIETFCSDFGIERAADPGLSIVVPFVHEPITPKATVQAVVRHCFHQIASGQLVVHVDGVQLTKETLAEQAAAHPALAKWKSAIELSLEVTKPDRPTPVAVVGDHLSERLAVNSFKEGDLTALRASWASGEIIAVGIPIRIEQVGNDPETGHLKLYLRRALSADQASETYIRGRISVTLSSKIVAQNAVALLAADPGPVSRFLGDAEQPNHRNWTVRRAEAKGYKAPEIALRIIKYALRDLHSLVTQTDETQDVKDVLKEFFNTPATAGKSNSQPNKPEPSTSDAETETADDVFIVTQAEGGFKVVLQSANGSAANFRVSAIYDVRRGKPKWSKADFDMTMEPVTVKTAGIGTAVKHPDVISVKDAKPGFELTVSGFDPNRDLKVRAEMEAQDV